MFRRIVVALDGSSLSEQSLPHAVALSQALGADLVLLRVIEEQQAHAERHPPDPLEWEARRAEAPAYLHDLADGLREQGVAAEVMTIEGDPADQIIAYARAEPKTLLVICSHGTGGLTGWSLGGVVQKTLLHAHVSLLVVRAFEEAAFAPGDLVYRRMLVCLDGSKRAECVLPSVSALARDHSMGVCFASVVENWVKRYGLPEGDARTRVLHELDRQRCETMRGYLEQVAEHHREEAMDATSRQEYDCQPLQRLHDLLAEEHADLVVMAAHGSGCSTRWPFGSVALNFVIYAETSLLVVQDLSPEEIDLTRAESTALETRGH